MQTPHAPQANATCSPYCIYGYACEGRGKIESERGKHKDIEGFNMSFICN